MAKYVSNSSNLEAIKSKNVKFGCFVAIKIISMVGWAFIEDISAEAEKVAKC